MSPEEQDPFDEYVVVVNHEEQYSVWPTARPVPDGWRALEVRGPKQACLQEIDVLWTDMRPLSLRARSDAPRGG